MVADVLRHMVLRHMVLPVFILTLISSAQAAEKAAITSFKSRTI